MSERSLLPPIKPDHAEAIGYVAAHWSVVEEFLAFLIYNLLGLEKIAGWALTAELSTFQRVSTISAFVNLTGKREWIETWDEITKSIDDLRIRRNDAVHSTWEVVGPAHFRLRVKAKGRVTIKQGPVYTPAIRLLAEEIQKLEERVVDFGTILLTEDAGKIINQPKPPGWPTPLPVPSQSPKAPPRNPRRERKQRRRALRRALDRPPDQG